VPQIEVEFVPTRVAGRRRRVPPGAIGLAIVTLLGLALVKPWGATTTPSPSASARVSAVAQASTTPSPVAPTAAPSASPVAILAGPPRLGTWGVAFATDAAFAPGRPIAWTGWTELDPVADRPEPPIRDPLPMDTDCAGVPTLQASPTIVALTVPDATPADFGIRGWWTSKGFSASLDGYLGRLDMPGQSPTAELARNDGWPWPDGRYEFHILTPDHVTALGFCLAPPSTSGRSPDQTTVDQIVHGLASRSGTWGVGAGGTGPRLVRDDPWTDWVAVEPVAVDGPAIAVWPDTGLCRATPVLLDRPSLVAVTVPPGLAPDWRLETYWSNGPTIVRLDGRVRQVSPPGNRGISYLEQVDGSDWPDGRYEFRVLAGDHATSLTVCIGAP
jgi:hypothetical protein